MLVLPLCWSCGGIARRSEPLCASCRGRLHRLAAEPVVLGGVRVWAPVGYAGPARDLVRALKFSCATRVAGAMAAQIAANAPTGFLGTPLVPVPLHRRRLRARGYNQAGVIAEALARRTGAQVLNCLVRSGSAATQVGRHRADRRAGPAGRVHLAAQPPEAFARTPPARVLLVDDVATTGATLAACAGALRAGGCAEIAAVAFARTIGR